MVVVDVVMLSCGGLVVSLVDVLSVVFFDMCCV